MQSHIREWTLLSSYPCSSNRSTARSCVCAASSGKAGKDGLEIMENARYERRKVKELLQAASYPVPCPPSGGSLHVGSAVCPRHSTLNTPGKVLNPMYTRQVIPEPSTNAGYGAIQHDDRISANLVAIHDRHRRHDRARPPNLSDPIWKTRQSGGCQSSKVNINDLRSDDYLHLQVISVS
jgi:hypothetical protein